jgi:hypothetical protein
MARKLPPPGLVTFAEFARMMGVSRSAITQAWKSGRLQAYDINGRPIRADGTSPRRHRPVCPTCGAPWTGEVPALVGWYRMKVDGHVAGQRYDEPAELQQMLQLNHASVSMGRSARC